MTIRWFPYLRTNPGKSLPLVRVAEVDGTSGRFFLSRNANSVKVSWLLYDEVSGDVFVLCGSDWERAQFNAGMKIRAFASCL